MLKTEKVDYSSIWCREFREMADSNLGLLVKQRTEQKIQSYIAAGCIPDDWLEIWQNFETALCERADILLFPTKKTLLEAEKILDGLTDVLAILAFVKQGVELFGWRFEASFDGSSKT